LENHLITPWIPIEIITSQHGIHTGKRFESGSESATAPLRRSFLNASYV
jgi:hypothetical protein